MYSKSQPCLDMSARVNDSPIFHPVISCVVPLTLKLQTSSFSCLKLAGVLADSAFLVAMAGRWTRGRSHFVHILILLPVCVKIAIAGDPLRRSFSSATTTVGLACWLARSAKFAEPPALQRRVPQANCLHCAEYQPAVIRIDAGSLDDTPFSDAADNTWTSDARFVGERPQHPLQKHLQCNSP